jgi:hypothetical protein
LTFNSINFLTWTQQLKCSKSIVICFSLTTSER